ncbi:hypothetical protein PVAP13_5NG257400 [Panicum virgatum]|uniref:Uncharacterized protein n=1 Tax=Panicum virgatum TaxID=38727 RepID=A0A8T0RSX2_PANVG|nr:hypothetical protein PVAP13_5NG257400 [Panicum virgatum]
MLLPTPCHVDNPSARRPCDLTPTPRRTGQAAPVRTHPTGPGRPASRRAGPRTPPLSSALTFFPRETPRLHTYDAPPSLPPQPRTAAPRSPASTPPPPASPLPRSWGLRRSPSGRHAAPRGLPRAPLPQTLTLAPGAGQCRCVLCSVGRSVRPPSGPHGPLGSQLRYVECRAVVWVGGLSGHCWETAPAAAELCCIWAGRAWGGTCAGPLHSVVSVPGLTGNVHG